MVGTSKILTVSYGTFSCTLEGFDDPFSTMKSIAEYFRDLAADDRYFGAEPPVPDAEMLKQIAEKEINRRVIARVGEGNVALRQVDEPAPAAVPAPAEDDEDAPALRRRDKSRARARALGTPVIEGGAPVPPPVPPRREPEAARAQPRPAPGRAEVYAPEPPRRAAPEDFAARMLRIRAAAARANASDAGFEDQGAERPLGFRPISDAFADAEPDPEPAAPPGPAEEPRFAAGAEIATEEDGDGGNGAAGPDPFEAGPPAAGVFAAAAADEAEAGAEAPWEPDAEDAALIAATLAATAPAAEVPAAETEDEAEAASSPAAGLRETGEDAGEDALAEEIAEEADEAPAPRQPAEEIDLAAILHRIAAGNLDTAPRPVEAEVIGETAPDRGGPEDDRRPVRVVRARVVRLRKPEAEGDGEAGGAGSGPLLLAGAEDIPPAAPARPENLFLAGEPEAGLPAGPALSDEEERDLYAALGAIRAEAEDADGAPQAPADPRRIRLERRDESDLAVTRILRETESQLDDTEASRRRSTIAHLKAAVAATRADREQAEPEDGDGEEDDLDRYRDDLQRVVRPRRPEAPAGTARRLAPLMLVSEQRVDLPEGDALDDSPVRPRRVAGNLALLDDEDTDDEDDVFADTTPFSDYAARVGAAGLPELIEAAAAYTAYVEGRPHASRPLLMRLAMAADGEGHTREDGLRAFGALLRAGRLTKLRRGQFTIARGSRFRPD